MDGQEHGGVLGCPYVVRNVGVENDQLSRFQLVVATIGLYAQPPLEDVDADETVSTVPIEVPSGLEREQDLRHVGSMKQGDLAMTVTRRVVLAPELREGVSQGEDVGFAGEPVNGGSA